MWERVGCYTTIRASSVFICSVFILALFIHSLFHLDILQLKLISNITGRTNQFLTPWYNVNSKYFLLCYSEAPCERPRTCNFIFVKYLNMYNIWNCNFIIFFFFSFFMFLVDELPCTPNPAPAHAHALSRSLFLTHSHTRTLKWSQLVC